MRQTKVSAISVVKRNCLSLYKADYIDNFFCLECNLLSVKLMFLLMFYFSGVKCFVFCFLKRLFNMYSL